MEKKLQQVIDSTTRALVSLITLRPLFRNLFSFKGALVFAIAIATYRLFDSLVSLVAGSDIFTLAGVPSQAYTAITVVDYVAYIAVLALILRMLVALRQGESERLLRLALKQGLLSEHEFQQKHLLSLKSEYRSLVTRLETSGVLTVEASEKLARAVEESYDRWIAKAALAQAWKAGAIDEATYNRRIAELGLS